MAGIRERTYKCKHCKKQFTSLMDYEEKYVYCSAQCAFGLRDKKPEIKDMQRPREK